MVRSLGRVLESTAIACQVSLEREMACGFGVCNGCVVEMRRPAKHGGTSWEKICVAGPVFDARDVKLERL
jgi:dihydroorotate dehydrogenase electron transfer subunit